MQCSIATLNNQGFIVFNGLKIYLAPMLLTSLIAGVILTVMAPYGTHALKPLLRLTYWVVLCMAGGTGAAFAKLWLKTKHPQSKLWVQAVTHSFGATVIVYIILIGFTLTYYKTTTFTHLITLPFFIWIIGIIICGFGVLMEARHRTHEPPSRPALYERLKPSLRQSDIYALCAEDHYVRVYTSSGEDLILMRLSDAIKDVTPLIGISVHRSWWVAERGVKAVKKKSGKAEIILKNEQIAPISRNRLKQVRASGWI